MAKEEAISPRATIGEGVKLWHLVYVGGGAVIGRGTSVGSLTHIDRGVKIGERCKIQGMVYIPPHTLIEDDCFIGPGVVFTNDPYPPSGRLSGVKVRRGAIVCAGAILLPGVEVGEKAVVGAGAIVTRDVPAGCVVVGNPARFTSTREEYDAKREAWERD